MSDGSGAFSVPMQPPVAPAQFYPGFQGVDHLQAGVTSMTVAQCSVPGQQKCAIPECPRPSYMEKNGKVHKCCGRTHARELEKRQCMYIQFQTTFIAVYVNLFLYLSSTKATDSTGSCCSYSYWTATWTATWTETWADTCTRAGTTAGTCAWTGTTRASIIWTSDCAYSTFRTEEMCHSRVPESVLCRPGWNCP